MRIHRGYLFWGIVLVLAGAIPLAERAGLVDLERFGDVGRWWPLILIAIGIGVLLARSRVAVIGTIAAGLVVGGLVGGALAYSNGWVLDFGDCAGVGRGELQRLSRTGTFTGPAEVELRLDCGTLDVSASTDTGWTLDAGYRGDPPSVEASGTRLAVNAPGTARRQEWTVALPASTLEDLRVAANAATASLDLDGAILGDLRVEVNAGEARIGGAGTTVDALDVRVNAGRARLSPEGDTRGTLEVNVGTIDLCVPPTANLRLEVDASFAFSTNLDDRDLERDGEAWIRDGTGPEIDLSVKGNIGTFTLDPEAGCR
jgi:hypothetical protein